MNWISRALFGALVGLALVLTGESVLEEKDAKQSDLPTLIVVPESFTTTQDPVTGAAFFQYDNPGRRTYCFRRIYVNGSESDPYCTGLDNIDAPSFVYDDIVIFVDKEGHEVRTFTFPDLTSLGTLQLTENILGSAMTVAGVKDNVLIVFTENAVKFVPINRTEDLTADTKNLATSLPANSTIFNVQQGVIVRAQNHHYFMDFSSEGPNKLVSISDDIDMSSGMYTMDKHGYLYVAKGAVVKMYNMSSPQHLASVLAQSSNYIGALHYDAAYDVIYITGIQTDKQAYFYMVPAGDKFSMRNMEQADITMSMSVTFPIYSLSIEHNGSLAMPFSTELSDNSGIGQWSVFVTEKCSSYEYNRYACFGDPQHCSLSLGDLRCKTISACAEGDMCVKSVPEITSITPNTGSTQGNTLVTVVFNMTLPEDSILSVLFEDEPINPILSTDRTNISFFTPIWMGDEGEANFRVLIGDYGLDGNFYYYSCNNASCSDCLRDHDSHPECVWVAKRNKCLSTAVLTQSDFHTDSDTFCPRVSSIDPKTVTEDSVIQVHINTLYPEIDSYYCLFSSDESETDNVTIKSSRFSREPSVVWCSVPSNFPLGQFSLDVIPNTPSYTPFSRNSSETLVLISCSICSDCETCVAMDGCNWCFSNNGFSCGTNTSCKGRVSYQDQCPFISNALYADAKSIPSEGKFRTSVDLSNANLTHEQFVGHLSCAEFNGVEWNTSLATCTYFDANHVSCTCEFSAEPGVESNTPVGLFYDFYPYVEKSFYAIKCNYSDPDSCFDDPSQSCVWDLEVGCIPRPIDNSVVSWVSTYPEVVRYSSIVDVVSQDVAIEFSSMVNSSKFDCFECSLYRSGTFVRNASMRLGNESTAFCNFGDLSKIAATERGSTAGGFSIEVHAVTSKVRDNSMLLKIFEHLNDSVNQTLTLLNCGAAEESLDCDSCRKVNDNCFWSKKKAMCTAAPDETTSHSECPTVTAVSPQSAQFEKGDNITLTGTLFVDGLKIRLTPDDSSLSTVEGNFIFLNDTHMNFTLENEIDPGEYKVSVHVESGRSFVDTKGLSVVVEKPPISIKLILAIVIPVFVVVVFFIILAIILIKKRGLHPFKFDVNKKPNFAQFAYATDIWTSGRSGAFPSDEGARDEFRALLQDPQVCAALCKATSSTEADKFTGAMVYVYATNGHCIDLLMSLVDQEVESVPNTTQLFRGNSLATKAFRAYSRMVGLNYLWMSLARFMHELNHLAKSKDGKKDDERQVNTDSNEQVSILSTEFEVDPSKLASGADEESQSYMLSQRARQLVLCITNSTQYLPPELRSFAAKLKTRVTQRFSDADHIAIGGTFFLRFICPAVIAPQSYGLLMTPDRKSPVTPSDSLQRQLVLLGKVLQNLANGVLFGKKEPFMIGMNDFITNNLPAINDWMDTISSGDGSGYSENPTSVPDKVVSDSYSFLASHVRTNMRKIRSALEAQNAPADLAQRLETAAGDN